MCRTSGISTPRPKATVATMHLKKKYMNKIINDQTNIYRNCPDAKFKEILSCSSVAMPLWYCAKRRSSMCPDFPRKAPLPHRAIIFKQRFEQAVAVLKSERKKIQAFKTMAPRDLQYTISLLHASSSWCRRQQ
jgi:hypothetical protein